MTKLIIRELNKGNKSVPAYFVKAIDKWSELVQSDDIEDVMAISGWCSDNQNWFELNCGGRFLGQEIMVTSGICGLYDPNAGWDDECRYFARNIVKGIAGSMCSLEVKGEAKRVAKEYGLIIQERS